MIICMIKIDYAKIKNNSMIHHNYENITINNSKYKKSIYVEITSIYLLIKAVM